MQPEMESLRKRLLSTALSFYKQLQATLEEGPTTPGTRPRAGHGLPASGPDRRRGRLQRSGLEALERARAILEDVVRADPTAPGPRRDLASCLEFIGRLEVYTSGQESEGSAPWRSLSSTRRCPPSTPTTPTTSSRSRSPPARSAMNGAYRADRRGAPVPGSGAGDPGRAAGRASRSRPVPEPARPELRRARQHPARGSSPSAAIARTGRRHLERLAVDHPETPVYRRRLGQVETDTGRMLSDAGRLSEGLSHSSGAGRSSRRWRRSCPPSPAISGRWRSPTTSWGRAGQDGPPGRGGRSLARARASLERLIADHPDFTAYQEDLAENYLWTGVVHQDSGRRADARVSCRTPVNSSDGWHPGASACMPWPARRGQACPLTEDGEPRPNPTGRWRLRRAVARGYRAPTTSGPTLASSR